MTTKLTPAERADLRQKAEQATPGPWEHVPFSSMIEAADLDHTEIATANDSEADAAYIAAISPDRLLALLDEVERLHAELASVASARMRVDIAKFHKGDRHD